MNVVFLSRLQMRTKGREGEVSGLQDLLFHPVAPPRQVNAAGFTAWYWLLLPFVALADLSWHHSGLSGRESGQCISETKCVSLPPNTLSCSYLLLFTFLNKLPSLSYRERN